MGYELLYSIYSFLELHTHTHIPIIGILKPYLLCTDLEAVLEVDVVVPIVLVDDRRNLVAVLGALGVVGILDIVGLPEVGLVAVGSPDIGLLEVGSLELGLVEARLLGVGLVEVGLPEVGVEGRFPPFDDTVGVSLGFSSELFDDRSEDMIECFANGL